MLDKSIPYKDLIMKWDGNRQCLLPVCVPPGYRLRTWREGDQKNWARIQKEAGEFGDMTLEQTETWFLQEYGDRKEELSFRCLFAESMDKEADGVCMAWTEAGTDGSFILPSLAGSGCKRPGHWNCPGPRGPGYSRAGERSRSFCTPSPGATRLLACI
ncbi:MAG: hypothetical protein ACLU8D_09425 [Enterocloster sp.]